MSSEQDYQDLFGPQAKKAKRGRQQLQTDKSANAIRIRDNQRRSRARHKEFVDELQRKVQEYEKRGIEASLQMQKAARDVAIENSRLRALLASRGVSNDQVDAYLRSFDDDPKGASSAVPITSTLAPILNGPIVLEPSPTQLPPLQEHFGQTFPPEPLEDDPVVKKRKFGDALLPPVLTLTPTPDVQQSSALDRLAVLADASLNRSSTQPGHPGRPLSEPSRSPHPYDRTSQTPPRPTAPPPPPPQHQQQQHQQLPAVSPHEMSCNAAARIIADMQGGNGDERKAKIALGCGAQDEECFVKNTSIFRMLDHR
ncbi:hypothetical protein CH063_10762 [Colletotrichum higginsianum]|uniref:BZIP domain-containing protein n=2 Tax=Colletotrichum higginsianum TaxID=80884 RepID=H1VIP7_COLHI|nr:hypothetical protein CH63R_03929 [Colletotrichum higginsianum IMI 349063]OBR11633.1 hypothetical protein CH63R_03929 [Colletotrichum higginsianum IMI 349063]TID00211.1 hypothetical protein CH35J_006189 [Colletotrichum higginsianum]CCF40100.1 hypothetical protein CH063_10762 [Colletotrichum higginsianum]